MEDESMESKEVIGLEEIIIEEGIFNELGQRTEHQHFKGEFWVFLLGQEGVVKNIVEVGQGGRSFIMTSLEEIVDKLRPFVEDGLKVLGDYHNHPDYCLEVYKAVGLPPEFVTAPSGSDVRLDVPNALSKELHQQQYPRIIGSYLGGNQGFVTNCFTILRDATGKEMDYFNFPDPNFTITDPDETGVQITGESCTDPRKLNELNIVKPARIKVLTPDGNIKEIKNAYSL